MRNLTSTLWSGTAVALALMASSASAQTAPAMPPDPTVKAQESPADPEAGAVETDDAVQTAAGADQATSDADTIVVTGLRRSLQSAQNLKKNSDQIVDAIVAEDIGKLPDIAVSDTAARIPGVQVERGGGEAGRVLVRGLPDFTTTYNGREIFTAETRIVALQDFPAGGVGAVEVFKSSTANLVEAGLAGLVNVRSRRPFDFKGFEIAGSVYGVYPKQSGDLTPNANLLITNRWEVGDGGSFGALINFSYTRLHYLDSNRSNTDFVAPGPAGSMFPDIQRLTYNEGDRSRPSINGALQYRPAPGLEFYIEGLWQGFRNKVSDRELSVPLWGGSQYTNLVFKDGTNLLESGTVSGQPGFLRPEGFQGGTFDKTNTYQFAIGGSYDAGDLRISGDLARTDSKFTGSVASVDYELVQNYPVDFVTGVDSDNGPYFDIPAFDETNPANYLYRGFFEIAQEAKGKDWQARLDAEYDTRMTFLPKIEVGVRYVDRDAHRERGDRYSQRGRGTPIAGIPLDYELFRSGFRGKNLPPLRRFISPTYSSIRNSLEELRTLAGFAAGPPAADPFQTYDANEKSTAGYAQVDYEFGGSIPVDGQIGMRVVKTDIKVQGTEVFGTPTPVTVNREYTDWLPNVSARVHFTDQLQLRLSATKTRTRPNFRDYNPAFSVGNPQNCPADIPANRTPTTCFRTGDGGNPDIKRLKSNNYDASLEYYFSRTGFASVAAFRRDLKGFIETEQQRLVDPIDGYFVRLNRPINSGKGRIEGFEAQVSTFFDYDFVPQFFRNFGVQANVTRLSAKADFNQFDPRASTSEGEVVNRSLLGVSKWSTNLVGMYEGGGLTVRLAYNRRSPFLLTYQRRNDFSSGDTNYLYEEKAKPVSRLDLSSSYTIIEPVTVFFDWTNILGKPFKSTLIRTDINDNVIKYPRVVRYEETVFSGGVRFRF